MNKFISEIKSLINEPVTFKRIAGNSIILYFNGSPGDANVKSIWIEPAWRYERANKYVVGSGDFPLEDETCQPEKEFRKLFESICAKTDNLVNLIILDISFDAVTNDIAIQFKNNQVIKSFVSSHMDEIWIYRDVEAGFGLCGYYNQIKKKKNC